MVCYTTPSLVQIFLPRNIINQPDTCETDVNIRWKFHEDLTSFGQNIEVCHQVTLLWLTHTVHTHSQTQHKFNIDVVHIFLLHLLLHNLQITQFIHCVIAIDCLQQSINLTKTNPETIFGWAKIVYLYVHIMTLLNLVHKVLTKPLWYNYLFFNLSNYFFIS